MLGLPAAALLACFAGQFDINAAVTAEGRAGEAPLTVDGTIRKGVIGIVMPDLQVAYLSRVTDVRLDYVARIFWRTPNDLHSNKPLILHGVNLVGTSQVTGRLQLTGTANMSVGESDYTALALVLPNQPALPSVADFFSLTAAAGALESLTRTEKIGLNLSYINRTPLGATAAVMASAGMLVPPFPHQNTFGAEPNVRLTLSRIDELTISAPVSYGTYTGGVDIVLAAPQVGWQRRLSRQYTVRLVGGLAYAHVEPALDTSSPFAPVADVGLDMQLDHRRGVVTRASGDARVDYFVDPVLGTAGPRLLLTLSWSSTLNPNWLVGVDATYSTVFVGKTPLFLGTTPVDETMAAVTLPVRYRASDNLFTEFGFRWSDRAPSVEVSAFGFHQRQLWLYVALTATTRRPVSRMVQ